MRFKSFFKNKVSRGVYEKIDSAYEVIYIEMCNALSSGEWSEAQQKVQKKNILPLIAVYKALISLGVHNEDAEVLSRGWFEESAKRVHTVLKGFTHVPFFRTMFTKIFKKQMSVPGIWDNKIIKDGKDEFVVDITKCLWKDTCNYFATPELCPIFCDGDWIVFGGLKKLHLEREGTLGLGDEKCDFKFIFDKNETTKEHRRD